MSLQSIKKTFSEIIARNSHDAMERQQLITYFVAVGLVMVGMTLHQFSVIGVNCPPLRLMSVTAILVTFLSFLFWLFDEASLKQSFTQIAAVIIFVQTFKIGYIAIALPKSDYYLILMNSLITMMSMILLAVSFIPKASIITGAVNVATLIAVAATYHMVVVRQFAVLIILFSVFMAFMAHMMYRNVSNLQDENKQYQNDEQRFLRILRLNRKEIRAYVEMCRTDNIEDKDTDRLFSMLSETSQRNVINAVERKKAIDASRTKELDKLLPDFTPMEMVVVRLVLRDYKLAQICDATGKSEANICVVRSKIRKKLGLKTGEDLREALLKIVGEAA